MQNSLLRVFLIPIGVLAICSLALGQGTDIEPNNTCETAQIIGAVTLPFTLTGSLDTPPTIPDIDFFRLTGTPNSLVRVDLEGSPTGEGTLADPLVGFFNSACQLIAFDDDAGIETNASLQFTIPSSGIFILAATDFADIHFTGDGSAGGSYRLTITPIPAAKSISGRLVDAFDGTPVRGDVAPFGFVDLHQCNNDACTSVQHVSGQPTDSQGRFRFERGPGGTPLRATKYRISASADQYQAVTTLVQPDEGEDLDVGGILLTPSPLQIFLTQHCGDLPAEGGTCQYLVTVRNAARSLLRGSAWSIIQGSHTGSPAGQDLFQTGKDGSARPLPQRVLLTPGKSINLSFQFVVPDRVADGAVICSQTFVDQASSPSFGTMGVGAEFCISQGTTGFTLMSEKKTRAQFRLLRGNASSPSR